MLSKTVIIAIATMGLAACTGECSRNAMYNNDDASITFHVNQALAHDPHIDSQQIHVETRQGVVQLSGFVDSVNMAQRAVADATKVEGVQVIKDNMLVE
jgi:osmotically-inducible protein OsmY